MNAKHSPEKGPPPDFLRPLFWDVNFDRLRIPGHKRYITHYVAL